MRQHSCGIVEPATARRGVAPQLDRMNDVLRAARDRLLLGDPGWTRLRSSARATAGAAACAIGFSFLVRAAGAPAAIPIVAAMLAAVPSIAVTDRELRDQRITLALAILPAAGGITLATLLSRREPIALAGFLAVTFVAVWLRRFGPRGTALGLVGFISYFLALFVAAPPEQLPWMLLGVCAGVSAAYVMHVWIAPDRPERVLRSSIEAFALRSSLLLAHAARAVRRGTLDGRHLARLHREFGQLDEAALQIEEVPGASRVRLRILEWELSVGAAGEAALIIAREDRPARPQVARALEAIAEVLRGRRNREQAHEAVEQLKAAAGPRATAAVARFAQAVADLRTVVRGEMPAGVDFGSEAEQPATGGQRHVLHPATRTAVQATLAGGLAILAGHLISPVRWYWAVIASYVVFARARTAGDTLVRAGERVLGTAVGIGAGMIAAELLAGRVRVEVALLFACLLLAYERLRASYAWMVFFLTIALALLYGVLGRFTPGTLLLRLEETAAGAGIGALVALLVVPARIRDELRRATAAALQELSVGLREWPSAARARAIDRRLRDVRAIARPLSMAGPLAGDRRRIAAAARDALSLGFLARQLAASPPNDGARAAAEQLAERAGAVADALEHDAPARRRDPLAQVPDDAAGHWLRRLDQVLSTMERDLDPMLRRAPAGGAPEAPAPGAESSRAAHAKA
jgi:uncharacterized membrane protein YccC